MLHKLLSDIKPLYERHYNGPVQHDIPYDDVDKIIDDAKRQVDDLLDPKYLVHKLKNYNSGHNVQFRPYSIVH